MTANAPGVASPILGAILDRLPEGVVIFDDHGDLIHANSMAVRALNGVDLSRERAATLLPRLAALGGRRAPLEQAGRTLGEAVFFRAADKPGATLAERERDAILTTLEASGGRLSETARRLGISRTTLWRRLKTYGVTLNREG